jgi:hypothetical protein
MRIGSLAPPETLAARRKRDLDELSATAKTQVEGIANQAKAPHRISMVRRVTVRLRSRTTRWLLPEEQLPRLKLLCATRSTQPYTAVFVALRIGWLLGRMRCRA